jgi:hypothetical protein
MAQLTQFLVSMPIYLRSILILSSYAYCLCLPKDLFLVGVFVKILKALLPFFPFWLLTFPFQSFRLHHPDYIR